MTWKLVAALPVLGAVACAQGPEPAGVLDQLKALSFAQAQGSSAGTGASSAHDDPEYRAGTAALDAKRFDEAIQHFNNVIGKKSPQADGAMYWKAYALSHAGRRQEARRALSNLEQAYPDSRWLDDAKALNLEIEEDQGAKVSPEQQSNEELKLIALNSLMQSDPERALPLLRQTLTGNQSQRVKDKALFVLSQSSSPEAKRILVDTARGNANPELQRAAVRYISMMGSSDLRGELGKIYQSTSDIGLKKEIIHSYLLSGSKDQLVQAATNEKNDELRREAIRTLAQTGGTGERFVEMYHNEPDSEVKRQIVQGLFIQQNAKALISLAREEKNPELKKHIVQQLALIQSKETTEYMMEILK